MEEKKKKSISLKSTNTVDGITDDQYYSIKDEFDQIRTSIGMYISKVGTDGALHLTKEIFNNALDECNNTNPYWNNRKKKIVFEFYESERRIEITDNGRGIPHDIITQAVMHKHTSTKTLGVSTIRNKKLTGLNGVGLTVTAALTEYMSMTSYRGSLMKTIELEDGVLTEHPIKKNKEFMNGTRVCMIPSEKYLGAINLTTDMMEDYLRNISYIIEPDVTIQFVGEKDPKAKKPKLYHRTFTSQGLSAACEYMSSTLINPPIEAKISTEDYDLSMAFSFDKTSDEVNITSFCNYVITTEGGVHESAATKAICEYFSREGRRQEPNSKYEITYDDCKKGLIIAVNLEHLKPSFEGQHKTRVSNEGVDTIGKKKLSDVIYNYMHNNPAILKKIITYLRQISKIRHEAHKIKGISVKKNTTFIEDAEIKKFFPVSNRNSTGYRECILAEGDGNVLVS